MMHWELTLRTMLTFNLRMWWIRLVDGIRMVFIFLLSDNISAIGQPDGIDKSRTSWLFICE